ncbi:protocatechuate 3,4-dioxygenase alpha subunit [Antricoccus suffuscus]|uniref:Protocatechuate 3,4-dioxygenase alpha subunit n=1 Tax=Antricoccus suffuscus TaxID=1629062 RepID=A0A2T1A1V7_9ACTN|nr:protocatechuate 3,4-dioxygenase subunit alpha [Antricoccus suffuscus]PRZ42477.1 protocatechuate 3,4-dioxygenase alpha subunit [Antricoccus suffuscus]
MTEDFGLTPSQTVGPFLHIALTWEDGNLVVPRDFPDAIRIVGTLYDGAESQIPDGLIETWQADPEGRFDHPDDLRGEKEPPEGFIAFGRATTLDGGHFEIVTAKPGPLPAGGGEIEAPHLNVSVFARGMLDRVVTRIYFSDEPEANAVDPVLNSVDPERRSRLIAEASAKDPATYLFDIYLQGEHESVFFEL